jgi:hypothetical protein
MGITLIDGRIHDGFGMVDHMGQANAAIGLPQAVSALHRIRYPSRGIFSLSRRV